MMSKILQLGTETQVLQVTQGTTNIGSLRDSVGVPNDENRICLWEYVDKPTVTLHSCTRNKWKSLV